MTAPRAHRRGMCSRNLHLGHARDEGLLRGHLLRHRGVHGAPVDHSVDHTPPTDGRRSGPAARSCRVVQPSGERSFAGTDATSGVRSCSAASYGGPDAAGISLSGTCTDVAGNTGSSLLPAQLRRHASGRGEGHRRARQPADGAELAGAGRRRVHAGGPGDRRWLARSPLSGGGSWLHRPWSAERPSPPLPDHLGRPGGQPRVGPSDRRTHPSAPAEPGGRCAPVAATSADVEGRQAGSLLQRPALPGRPEDPDPLAEGRATPAGQALALRRDERQLGPGRYEWFVFPGFGPRSERRYGKLLGSSRFTVTR